MGKRVHASNKERGKMRRFSKEIADTLESLSIGLCFAAPTGRIILINGEMRNLCERILTVTPQRADEICYAIKSLYEIPQILSGAPGCYEFPEGSIYQFKETRFSLEGVSGWQQLVLQNVTKEVKENLKLQKQNEQLLKIIKHIKKNYESLEKDVKEDEILTISRRLHSEMGKALISASKSLQEGVPLELDISCLQEKIFRENEDVLDKGYSWEESIRNAQALGVDIIVSGLLPEDEEALFILATALDECSTNCIRHAKGNEVYVNIIIQEGEYEITFTNNGDAPRGKIQEGSGLSSLRETVEKAGGKLEISSDPYFELRIYGFWRENPRF